MVTFLAALLPFVAGRRLVPTAVVLYFTGHHGAGIGLAIYGTLIESRRQTSQTLPDRPRDEAPCSWLFLSILGR
jgi:hypothetical protein